MQVLSQQEFGGERPLFGSSDLKLEQVTIHAGESALKECRNIVAENCVFEGKYPFWHNDGFVVRNCTFTSGARAALWYSRNLTMEDTRVEAPKMFRDMENLSLRRVTIPHAAEMLWHCRNVELEEVSVAEADYLFLHSEGIRTRDYRQDGNYSFQYARDIVIEDAIINSKDAFWNTHDVTVRNATLNGEYLGWHSHRLHLVNCHISGTQPLCYAHDLVLENCTFAPDADLCFEYSTVQAEIKGPVTSVKNPTSGSISADGIGEIILDAHVRAPGDCRISDRLNPR